MRPAPPGGCAADLVAGRATGCAVAPRGSLASSSRAAVLHDAPGGCGRRGISGGASRRQARTRRWGAAEPTGGLALAAYNLLHVAVPMDRGVGHLGARMVRHRVAGDCAVGGRRGVHRGRLRGRGSAESSARPSRSPAYSRCLLVFPVYLLTAGGDAVGSQFQPRYLLPLVVLFALVLVTAPSGARTVRFTGLQTVVILGALARREPGGAAGQHSSLRHGRRPARLQPERWRPVVVGRRARGAHGRVAHRVAASFAGLLAVLWPELQAQGRRALTASH